MGAEQKKKKGSPLFEGEISAPKVVMLEKLAQDKEFRTCIGELLQGGCHRLVNHEGRVSVDMEFHTPNTLPSQEQLEQVVKRISHLTLLPVCRAALAGAEG